MLDGYRSWCHEEEEPNIVEPFRELYSNKIFLTRLSIKLKFNGAYLTVEQKHQLEDGRAEMIARQIQAICDERAVLDRKCSQVEVYLIRFKFQI